MKTFLEIVESPFIEIMGLEKSPVEEGVFGLNGYWHDPVSKKRFLFVFSNDNGWEHLSVSRSSRCPTWEEMCRIKDVFFTEDDRCVEYHPPKSEYVNIHPYCLHIWKPIGIELPYPPNFLVV